MIKFIYFEKATKFCEIFSLLLSYVTCESQKRLPSAIVYYLLLCLVTFIETQTLVPVKSKVKILQNYVAFSEYMNFNKTWEQIFFGRWKINLLLFILLENRAVFPFFKQFLEKISKYKEHMCIKRGKSLGRERED